MMKKSLFILTFTCIAAVCSAQKVSKEKPVVDTAKRILPNGGLPPGTVIFALSPEQVNLLEVVIDRSAAPYWQVNDLIKALRTQQTVIPKDSTAVKK